MREHNTIVVKVGTNVLTAKDGGLDIELIEGLVDQIASIHATGMDVVLVSSGAVGAGKTLIKLQDESHNEVNRQAYSAIGQAKLMNIYSQLFAKHDMVCAQVLATKEDFSRSSENYKNMKQCFNALIENRVVAVVNENDVVSLTELMFTDNDELAGLVAFMAKAKELIIMTNVDGVYDGPPQNPDSSIINTIENNMEEVMEAIETTKSSGGRGGMKSKIAVASRMREKGIITRIMNGKTENVLTRVVLEKEENIGTTVLTK